jgi:hypothetical protein
VAIERISAPLTSTPRATTARTTPTGAIFLALFLCLAALALATCSTGGTNRAKYPRRPAGCAIAVVHQSTPPVPEWDDLGMVEASCYLEEGPGTCLKRLKAEGCRMGGDIIYDVPKRPARPTERALMYRAHVAHSKTTVKPEEPEAPSDAGSGPVIPLGSAPHEAVSPPPSSSPDAGPAAEDAGAADAALSTL